MELMYVNDLLKGVCEPRFPQIFIQDVVTDSRQVTPGCAFIAIKGENFDGNDYVQAALEAGATIVVTSRPSEDSRCVVVEDTLEAYAKMAENYRERFSPICVGITGSVGKTNTKDMVGAIFSRFGKTLKSPGNRNNEIGLPETVLKLESDTKLAVFEMGMSNLGEISRLSKIAKPQGAIITCIGVSHIESLGSRENILKAKLEIMDGLQEDGFLVLNADDDMLMGVKNSLPCKTVWFGIDHLDSDVVAIDVICDQIPSEFKIVDKEYGTFQASIPCSGIHAVRDALSAYALATRLGLNPAICAEALSDYSPSGMRQRFQEHNGITVIEDCYNANPDSMNASLEMLANLPCNGIKVAVLGDMLELGEISQKAHQELGSKVAALDIDLLLCCGEQTKWTVQSALDGGVTAAIHFDNKLEIADYLKKSTSKGDMILFKASRGIALEEVMELFYEG